MQNLNIGLVGYGTVGQGVAKIIKKNRQTFKNKFQCDFVIKSICDRSLHKKNTKFLGPFKRVKDFNAIIDDPDIDVIVELIGGKQPAKEIVEKALMAGKDVVTANKDLIANHGLELFAIAESQGRHLYYESAVGAGIPIIKTISETIAGNSYKGLFGIINGTCNFILDEMTTKKCTFESALKDAQRKGYAEADPTLDVNGMDCTHKLAILTLLAFGKNVPVKDIYTEGIENISDVDIAYADSLNMTIKLLAIAKESRGNLEVRVHPTLITKKHPLSSINSIYNAVYLNAVPMGDIMLSGEGAGQMAAASGVIADLINSANAPNNPMYCNHAQPSSKLNIRKIDHIETKFYIRINAADKPGVLSQVTGILGRANISINSVTQQMHDNTAKSIPILLLTENTTERQLRLALNKIQKLPNVEGKPVAIRMEKI